MKLSALSIEITSHSLTCRYSSKDAGICLNLSDMVLIADLSIGYDRFINPIH